MRQLIHRRRQTSRSGVTTVEVAITFPILILVVALIFEMSRAMMVLQNLEFAAQRGAREASLATTLTETQVTTEARRSMQPVITNQADVVNVQVSPSGLAGVTSGTPITVNVRVSLSDISWVPGTILDFLGNPTLSASAVQDRE